MKWSPVAIAISVVVSGCSEGTSAAQMRNPIPDENQLPGDPDWMSHVWTSWKHQIEGYTDRVNALAGDTVQVMMRSDTPRAASWALYRLGWYCGAGARKWWSRARRPRRSAIALFAHQHGSGFADGTGTTGSLGFADGAGTNALMLPQGGLGWRGAPGRGHGKPTHPAASCRTPTRLQRGCRHGRATEGSAPRIGPARAASFGLPLGLFRARDGTVFVADGGAGSLRAIRP